MLSLGLWATACAVAPKPKAPQAEPAVHPASVVKVMPFERYALAQYALVVGDSVRALRELGLAADAAPGDPFLQRKWRRAKALKP